MKYEWNYLEMQMIQHEKDLKRLMHFNADPYQIEMKMVQLEDIYKKITEGYEHDTRQLADNL